MILGSEQCVRQRLDEGDTCPAEGNSRKWEIQSGDLGRIPEDDAMYDSDMEVATQRLKRKNPEAFQQYQKNIEVMKKWKSEG